MEKIQCNKCGADNLTSSKYCSNCGYELPKTVIDEAPQAVKPVKTKKKLTKEQLIGLFVSAIVAAIVSTFVSNMFFSKPTIDKVLVETANTMNKTLPVMIDADTRIDNVMAFPNKIFMYNYTLVNYEKETFDTIAAKNYLEPRVLNTIKTSPEMKYQRDNNVTLQYRYSDKSGNYLFSFKITPEQYK